MPVRLENPKTPVGDLTRQDSVNKLTKAPAAEAAAKLNNQVGENEGYEFPDGLSVRGSLDLRHCTSLTQKRQERCFCCLMVE